VHNCTPSGKGRVLAARGLSARVLVSAQMRAQPVLKWAGGKTQILDRLLATAPRRIGTYYEPFVGGGALFFALSAAARIEDAVLSDLNEDLLNLYRTIGTRPEALAQRLATMEKQYISQGDEGRRSYFYAVRAATPTGPVAAAARLIFLNRTCYNGLYRVNRNGQFNVPYGRYRNPKICDATALRAAAKQLQMADIRGPIDFSVVLEWAKPGDFVYLDPPYQPMTKTSSLT
jgi:DNA adenine methylase